MKENLVMHIEKFDSVQKNISNTTTNHRPSDFKEFIGQQHIVNIIETAIASAKKNNHTLGHILLGGPSGYGKTTLAHIISNQYGKKLHIITGYAISKPSEMISILNTLEEGDILFIDEIHRLKPTIEEIMYIAMEDFAIDMVMPDGDAIRIPLKQFTLIGATTQLESLSSPLKNRFIYQFHCIDYNEKEKMHIIQRYCNRYSIHIEDDVLPLLARKVESIPRKIHNFVLTIRDYLISNHTSLHINYEQWTLCEQRLGIKDGGITRLHQKYLDILTQAHHPLGIRTIASQLGINPKSIEEDIEPLLLKQNLIIKSSQGRALVRN